MDITKPLENDWILLIADKLGEEKTRKDLIPLLNKENIDDVNGKQLIRNWLIQFLGSGYNTNGYDNFRLTLAQQLGDFVPYVGGAKHAHILLQPLEFLSIIDGKPHVREAAVDSLSRVGAQLDKIDLDKFFYPLAMRLASSEDRVSVCGLFNNNYPIASENFKTQWVSLFCQLCEDSFSVVRKSALLKFEKFVANVEPFQKRTFIMPVFKRLIYDGEDSVRQLAVEAFGKLLEPEDCEEYLQDIVVKLIDDEFWGVRCTLANQLCELCEKFKPKVASSIVIADLYAQLLQDKQVEVRVEALGKVTKFCKGIISQARQHIVRVILPSLMDLSSDPTQDVRYALALVIFDMALVLGESANELRPICLSLLQDEGPYVKVRTVINLEQLAKIISLDQYISVLLDIVLDLGEHKDWRIRHAIIQCMPLLADQLGQNFFNKAVCQYCLQWLGDQVSSVYDAAVKSLKLLALKFGVEWVVDHLLPHVPNVINNFEGGSRQKSLGVISDILGPKLILSKLVPMIVNAPTIDRIVPEMEVSVERFWRSLGKEVCDNL